MKVNLHEFTIGIESDLVTSTSLNYRPPSWPPPRDWPVVVDRNGTVISCWGDPRWNLSPWAGEPTSLNFSDSEPPKAEPLDAENADLMRMIATWIIWGGRPYRSVRSVTTVFSLLRQIVTHCSRNSISAAKLMRFPKVFERLPDAITSSQYHQTIALLHRLYDAREVLGFTIVDPDGLRRLAATAPDHDTVQTPYIPPRIWLYQVKRLHECLTDFLAHREQIEACFRLCLDRYIKHYGSLEAALGSAKTVEKTGPFNSDYQNRKDYLGTFSVVAARFGIAELLTKWVGSDLEKFKVTLLSNYFTTVTYAALAYLANFTLQRKEEIASLRTSCLLWEDDEELGRVPIICGETTKTDPDSDARWVASPSVEVAIQAAAAIAHLRMVCDRANPVIHPTAADQDAPYLWSTPTEPWGIGVGFARPYAIRQRLTGFGNAMKHNHPLLLDHEQMKMTTEDLEVARQLTPNLPEDEFAVGKVWPLSWHQYRRTGSVNMFAWGGISDSTMQQQLKHSSRLMPLYYGRNHSRLHLNKDVESAVVIAMYQAQAAMFKRVASSDRFVAPHSPEHKEALVMNVLSAKDTKTLIAMAKKGTIAFREHRLGGCMKAGACEYGGVESVARCAGGDDGKPCSDVLYDREKEAQVRADLRRVTEEIKLLRAGQPRYNALVEERRAMENYLNVISAR
jgi:hypothetical protein